VEPIDKQLNKLRTHLKMRSEFVMHSLRHSFGTMLGQSGVDAIAITKIMGHSTVKVSERYIGPSEEVLRLAFEKVQNRPQPATISATVAEGPSVGA
jgi:site-specific recombinase XerD